MTGNGAWSVEYPRKNLNPFKLKLFCLARTQKVVPSADVLLSMIVSLSILSICLCFQFVLHDMPEPTGLAIPLRFTTRPPIPPAAAAPIPAVPFAILRRDSSRTQPGTSTTPSLPLCPVSSLSRYWLRISRSMVSQTGGNPLIFQPRSVAPGIA